MTGPHGGHLMAWQRNPVILERMERVQRLYDQGLSIYKISAALGIPYGTVQDDVKRINTTYRQLAGRRIDDLRAETLRRQDAVIRRAVEQLEEDRKWAMAVLFDLPYVTECPGGVVHRLVENPRHAADPDAVPDVANAMLEQVFGAPEYGRPGERCPGPHMVQYRVWRDAKGSASFTANPAHYLEVIRKTLMDKAKLEGLVIDKVSPTDGKGNDLGQALAATLQRYARKAGSEPLPYVEGVRTSTLMPALGGPDEPADSSEPGAAGAADGLE